MDTVFAVFNCTFNTPPFKGVPVITCTAFRTDVVNGIRGIVLRLKFTVSKLLHASALVKIREIRFLAFRASGQTRTFNTVIDLIATGDTLVILISKEPRLTFCTFEVILIVILRISRSSIKHIRPIMTVFRNWVTFLPVCRESHVVIHTGQALGKAAFGAVGVVVLAGLAEARGGVEDVAGLADAVDVVAEGGFVGVGYLPVPLGVFVDICYSILLNLRTIRDTWIPNRRIGVIPNIYRIVLRPIQKVKLPLAKWLIHGVSTPVAFMPV